MSMILDLNNKCHLSSIPKSENGKTEEFIPDQRKRNLSQKSYVSTMFCRETQSHESLCHGHPPLHLKRRGEKDQRTNMRRGKCPW